MRYYIIAGEASGDLHGSNLMKGLYAQDKDAVIRFWGGDLMEAVWKENKPSCDSGLAMHYRQGAVMGFVEVLTKAKKLLNNLKECKKDILNFKADVIILIDYPGFNFKIAKFAHEKKIPVHYYIAPKVWASREGRIEKLRKFVDKLFIVFPFEVPYFKKHNIDATYLGNPLVDAIDNGEAFKYSREEWLRRNNLDDRPIIALLAGSRKSEINSMMPVLVEFSRELKKLGSYSNYQFIVAGAPARTIDDYSNYYDERDDIKVIFSQVQSIVKHSEAAVVNSGTASLETALLGTPQVVGYRMNPITYRIAQLIIKIKYISLGNLIVDKFAFKELIQNEFNTKNLITEVRKIIENEEYRQVMLDDYAEIKSLLGGGGASLRVAKAMIEELKQKGQ